MCILITIHSFLSLLVQFTLVLFDAISQSLVPSVNFLGINGVVFDYLRKFVSDTLKDYEFFFKKIVQVSKTKIIEINV